MSNKAGIGITITTYNRREQLLQESPLLSNFSSLEEQPTTVEKASKP